jgi:hypothetical protein
VASATNTGKLSSTDWSTFNNKQNTITDPITGIGNSTQIAYFNSPTSITSEAAFNYDASTNRLGVNTSVPNATIGANAGTDSGYSLLVKNDNANYNGIGFATTSTYGNVIGTEKLGTAPARNLTLLNQSGYISITEIGNLGVNILNPNTGLDIYNGTSAYLWLHTANSGITGTDGVRLALFSNNGANLRNFEGAMSITSEGDFSIITIGAENFRVNSADGSIYQSKVANALLKSVSGVITAAVANTDYQSPISLTTSGSSGAATFSSNILNVPNYTLSGLGGVPTSRELTINGTTYDLSANRSWTITSDITGSGADGRVAYWNGTNSITSEAGFIYDASTNRLGVNTSVPNATIGADAALNSGYGLLIKTGASNYNGIGIAIDSTYGNTIETAKLGTASARNLTLLNQSGFVSLTEAGAFGVGILTPNNGIDIYNSTQSQLWLHNNASGLTATDGVRLALFNNLSANLRNFDGGLSLTAEGDFQIITIGAENLRVNSANGFVGIGNPATLPSMLTVNGGATITGLTTGQVLFPTSGGTLSGSNSLFWDNATDSLRIGSNTSANRRLSIFSSSDANHFALISNAPAITLSNNFSYTYYATIGMATASNNFVAGTVAGDLVLGAFNTNSIIFSNANTNTQRMKLTSGGDLVIGATSADTKLDVRGEISLSYSASNGLRFYNQDRSNWSSIGNDTATGSSNANLVFRTSAGTAMTIAANRNVTLATALSGTSATFSDRLNVTKAVSENIIIANYDTNNRMEMSANGFNLVGGNPFYIRQASGANQLTITTGGNVGINTATANFKLHISTGSTTSITQPTAGTYGLYIQQNTSGSTGGLYIQDGASNSGNSIFVGDNNGAARFVVNTDGNVGIGTSSPSSILTVLKTITTNYGAKGNGAISLGTAGSANEANLINFGYDAGTWQPAYMGYLCTSGAGSSNGALVFATRDSTSDVQPTERMRITSGGNVGIGTSTPTNFSQTGGGLQLGNGTDQKGISFNVLSGGWGYIEFYEASTAKWISGFRSADNSYNIKTGSNLAAGNGLSISSGGNVTITGSLSKGSGSFRIDHPLESMTETHELVHSFVESPQANNIYRGKVQLENGFAQVNLDDVSTMTEGTFVILNREIHTYTSNETDWDAVRGKVEGNVLTIECQNNKSNAIVSWLVIGERQDKHMMETAWTDENGRVIVEPLKETKAQIEELKAIVATK